MARYFPTLVYFLLMAVAVSAQTVQLVDVEAVRVNGEPSSFLRAFTVPARPREIHCDILVAGAGTGGFAAALRAAERGHTVCLTEETDWIGGQITAGGVSALDENRYIEFAGGTRSYYEMREGIRSYYKDNYPLTPEARAREDLNPGACYVSPLCFEPKAGLAVLDRMLAPHRDKIQLLLRTVVFSLDVKEGRIQSALAYQFEEDQVVRIVPRFVLDATETGDLLPLAGVPYVAGSEARADTGEPHAAVEANPACVQSFTYPFAIDVHPEADNRIPKPPEYEKFRDGQPFAFRLFYQTDFGWRGYFQYKMFGEDPPIPNNQSPGSFFNWRRLLAEKNFTGPEAPGDLALINWPRQDYHSESILDRTPLDQARILQQAKRVSLAFLYWLQTDLARDDGDGTGYPELRLRKDVMDTEDGLSKTPYFREARRIVPKSDRVAEQDIVSEYQPGLRARRFQDSVGTGFYMVDIHPCGANERGRMMMPRPFQIPMRALMPQKVTNLLSAGKNIGVTHVTNGAFRLHPVEWNVGEAAATIASLSLQDDRPPLADAVQQELAAAGVPLVWFDDLHPRHPQFAAIHWAAIRGIYPVGESDLHASPDAPITRREAAYALSRFFELPVPDPVQLAVSRGWMAVDHRNWFHGDMPLYWTDFREDQFPSPLAPLESNRSGPVTRSELASRLYSSR
ncbi:MAG: FAD-dependent oxidoreductase [Bryobacterales bacterium]